MTPDPPPPARPPRTYSLLHQQLEVLRFENKGFGQARGTARQTATEHFDGHIQTGLKRCLGQFSSTPSNADFVAQPPKVLDRAGFEITTMDLLLQLRLIIFLYMHKGDIGEYRSEKVLD